MPETFLDQIKITADSIQKTKAGLLLSGARVGVELPGAPRRYLYSGWQSWSLTAWVETGRPVRPMRPWKCRMGRCSCWARWGWKAMCAWMEDRP
jgi:hypothetical protein